MKQYDCHRRCTNWTKYSEIFDSKCKKPFPFLWFNDTYLYSIVMYHSIDLVEIKHENHYIHVPFDFLLFSQSKWKRSRESILLLVLKVGSAPVWYRCMAIVNVRLFDMSKELSYFVFYYPLENSMVKFNVQFNKQCMMPNFALNYQKIQKILQPYWDFILVLN